MTLEETTMYEERIKFIYRSIDERTRLAKEFRESASLPETSEVNKSFFLNSAIQCQEIAYGMKLALEILFPTA